MLSLSPRPSIATPSHWILPLTSHLFLLTSPPLPSHLLPLHLSPLNNPSSRRPTSEARPHLQHRRLGFCHRRSWRRGPVEISQCRRHRALGRAGVGAVATQSLGNTAYGERGLELIAQGATAEEALRIVMRTDTMLQDRQVGMVDARGNAASFTGTSTFDWAGGRVGAPRARATSPGKGRGDRWPRLFRPGEHHGVGPDGKESGGDLRAEPGSTWPTG